MKNYQALQLRWPSSVGEGPSDDTHGCCGLQPAKPWYRR